MDSIIWRLAQLVSELATRPYSGCAALVASHVTVGATSTNHVQNLVRCT